MLTKGKGRSRRIAALHWGGARQALPATVHHPAPRGAQADRTADVAGLLKPNAPIDPGQLARAIAEIEKASAALRRSEPTLELWRPGWATLGKKRGYISVWILIGGIWISDILVLSATVGAILYLFG